MTLRNRAFVAAGVALAALAVMGAIVLVQYAATAVTNSALIGTISPAVDKSADLGLEQSNASGDLADYLMLQRPESLDSYRQTIGRATTLLEDLRRSLADDTELSDLVAAATSAQRVWIKTDAEPAISLMEAGKAVKARKQANTPEAWAAYDAMVESTNALHDTLNRRWVEASDALSGFTRTLGTTLLVVGVLVLLGFLLFFMGLQLWVLVPLSLLRDDLTRATRTDRHTTPIRDHGPPEIADVAHDAEELRRSLVEEIDSAESARQGLMQDAPLVAAMQDELAVADVPEVSGFELAGYAHSAEGVVAGDWWDAIARPDGSLALVVADVSGHGPQAGITALRIRAVLRTALREGADLDVAVARAADAVADDEHFATAIVISLNRVTGTITWCNAGHHPAITVTRDKEAALCEPTGPLISSLGGQWGVRTRFFSPGDVVVAFTDGLVESRNAEGDELEAAAVGQFIRGMDGHLRENPKELITRLLAQVRHRAADWRRDDVTVIAACRHH